MPDAFDPDDTGSPETEEQHRDDVEDAERPLNGSDGPERGATGADRSEVEGDDGDDASSERDDAGGGEKARKLTREEAREAAEAEKAAREQQSLEEALELARADAERTLAGPGLVTPDPPIPPLELEAGWSTSARVALDDVRDDLDGQRLGLAISGGGALGSFEAGALRFLYDHVGIDPVAICGNSAGALNAAKLAEGNHVDRRPIDEVERIWRSLRINSDMWEPEPWLVRLQASASWAAELREQVSDADGATSAVKVAVRVVGSLVRRPPETDGTIDAVKEAIRAQSLLSLSPIAELVERELDPERIRDSGIALRVGTVSLEAGELRYVTETGQLHDRHDHPVGQPAVALASGVLASASIPMAFPPVEMNGEHYVDGGAREILPLEFLATRMGAERVIAISASSASIKRAPSFADRNLIDILRRVSAEIGPNETLRKELNPPGGWDPHVRLVVPEFDVHDSMTIDPALIAISLDHGYLRAADVILTLGPQAADLTQQITRLRTRLRHLAGPIPTFLDTALGRDRRERLEGRTALPTVTPDPAVIEVEVVHAEDDGEGRGGEGVVRSARSRTATTVAKLVKVIGRDNGDRHDGEHELEAGEPGDGDEPGDDTVLSDPTEDGPHTVRVEIGVVDDDGADVQVHQGDGTLEVVVAPRAVEIDAGRGNDDAASDQPDSDSHQDDHSGPIVPDLDDDQGLDDEADEARRAEVRQVTAELRTLVQQRHDLGLPLPQTLLAWLHAGPDPGEADDPVERLHPVGGAALGGV